MIQYRVYPGGIEVALTSGNDWVDASWDAGTPVEYTVETVGTVRGVSTTSASILVGDPGTLVPALSVLSRLLLVGLFGAGAVHYRANLTRRTNAS